jgi:hypothetical protein
MVVRELKANPSKFWSVFVAFAILTKQNIFDENSSEQILTRITAFLIRKGVIFIFARKSLVFSSEKSCEKFVILTLTPG